MGNIGSSRGGRRRRRSHPQPEITANANGFVYVYTAAAVHPSQNPNSSMVLGSNSQPSSGAGVNPPPVTANSVHGPDSAPSESYVEHQKAETIRNHVNIKKETLRIEPDEDNPGNFLVAFSFDATAPGSITVMFFAKETIDGKLIAVKEIMLKQVSMPFQQGLCQKFKQTSGTGIGFSLLEDTELKKEGDMEVYPLVLKAETDGNPLHDCQVTLASFEKREKGEYEVQVMKQILWVKGQKYELQEIYGIGNTGDGDIDGNESGRECVICLSEPRDITVLPCRHMCMCSGCAKLLRSHTDSCPICRHPVERLMEIRMSDGPGDP
ncbi:hypothetical protein L6164_019110 [Bauhinia variegata]|uniref:Uncharacterized protein n=1 Tax=Bauhinia variegata TaxID=167791 RepID=A0ACB9NEF7_BAUVA|nr:hypothetical protein L6164_019110 [Bauhinia variegata]